MQGYQVTFYTEEGRHHGHQQVHAWLTELALSLGIQGTTTTVGVEGIGRDGKRHSAHFFELSDQPVEVTMAVTAAQCDSLFQRLEEVQANLFYVKTPVEFGVVGRAGSG